MRQMTGTDGGLGRGFANWDAAASAVVGANKKIETVFATFCNRGFFCRKKSYKYLF